MLLSNMSYFSRNNTTCSHGQCDLMRGLCSICHGVWRDIDQSVGFFVFLSFRNNGERFKSNFESCLLYQSEQLLHILSKPLPTVNSHGNFYCDKMCCFCLIGMHAWTGSQEECASWFMHFVHAELANTDSFIMSYQESQDATNRNMKLPLQFDCYVPLNHSAFSAIRIYSAFSIVVYASATH